MKMIKRFMDADDEFEENYTKPRCFILMKTPQVDMRNTIKKWKQIQSLVKKILRN